MGIKHKISQFRHNADAKTLFENFFSLSFLQIAGYVFPFITLPYLSRVIGVERFGDIAFAQAIMLYCQAVVDFGFIYSAVRDIARCRDDKQSVSEIYSTVMWSRFLLVFVSFAILIACILSIDKLYDMRYVLLVSFIAVPGHAMFPDWLVQGIEKMKYITIFSLLMKLVFTILVFVLIKSPDDYLYQPLLIGLGYVVSGVLAMSLIKRMGIKLHRPQFSKIKVALKSNVDLFINQIVPNLYNSLSTILLGFMHGSVANGIFDAGNRFNLVSTQFMNVISRTFFPYLSRKLSKHDMYVRLHLSFSVICAVALFAFAPLIIDIFFSKEYYDAVIVLRIMSVSLIFLSLDNIYGTNYLIVVGEEKTLRNITFISSIIGFACAIPMAYYYSYTGVAIVIVFTRCLMALLITHKALKIKRQKG